MQIDFGQDRNIKSTKSGLLIDLMGKAGRGHIVPRRTAP
jgi:hypothetical protein